MGLISFFVVILSHSGGLAAESMPIPEETKAQHDARMAWWRDARFGMFIHWGLFSLPNNSWNGKNYDWDSAWIMQWAKIPHSDYEKLAAQLTAEKYDARQWVRLAKQAGMKYIIITTKHHEGFSMWNTAKDRYNIMTAAKRDVLKELAEACKEEGMRLGFYYSIMDWHHPDAQGRFWPDYGKKTNPDWPRYVDHMKAQLKELLTQYGPIIVLFFDGEWVKEWTDEQGMDLYAYCRSLQPSIIINNRVAKGRKGMEGFTEKGRFAGDYGTPEQQVPANGLPGVDWESCMTMNGSWGYNNRDNWWKSSANLIHNLADIVSKGGNYLLNIGPKPDGEIPPQSVERLQQVGDWMKINGESIYGTGPSPFPKAPVWGRVTAKDGLLYLHVFKWPEDGKLEVPLASEKVEKAWLLADASKAPLSVKSEGEGLVLTVPVTAPDKADSVVVLKTKDGRLPR